MKAFDEFDPQQRRPDQRKGCCAFPLVTSVVVVNLLLLHMIASLDLFALDAVVNCAGPVFELGQAYRVFASVPFHSSTAHLISVLLVFVYLGARLEQTFGSFYYSILLAALSLAANVLWIATDWAMYYVWDDVTRLLSCGCGMSGLVCAMLVAHMASSSSFQYQSHEQSTRAWMVGCALLSAALLAVGSVVVPGRLVLHLAGLAVGSAYVAFCLDGLPAARASIEAMETSHDGWLASIVELPAYCKCPSADEELLNDEGDDEGRPAWMEWLERVSAWVYPRQAPRGAKFEALHLDEEFPGLISSDNRCAEESDEETDLLIDAVYNAPVSDLELGQTDNFDVSAFDEEDTLQPDSDDSD